MILGIICEFNPFHKGHQYLIDSVKGKNDYVIAAMSGSFVQRGEPAALNKFERTRAALTGGADMVLEIPSYLSVRSAQGFARAGVRTLEATGICQALAFGAECDNLEALKQTAKEIVERDSEIKAALAEGLSYPQARQKVISSPLLYTPNNILAIEYLTYTTMKPLVVKRIGLGHDSCDAEYSASEIRKTLPKESTADLKNCEKAVLYRLRNMKPEDFLQLEDVGEGLENRIDEAIKSAATLEALYDAVKTKRYTHSRIRRILLRAFLGIDKSFPSEPEYLRVLGFSERGKALMPLLQKNAALPLVSKYADAKAIGGSVLALFEEESRITDIHALCYKTPRPCGLDKTSRLITVNGN